MQQKRGEGGMETEPKIIQRNLQEVGSTQCGPLCFPTNKTNGLIHIIESRSLLQSSGCSAAEVDSQVLYASPPFLFFQKFFSSYSYKGV